MGATSVTSRAPPPIPAWIFGAYADAQAVLDAGRADEAERAFREIARGRGEGSPWPEIVGLTGLSTAWSRRGRTFEALVLLRRLGAALLALGDDVKAAGVLGNHALVLSWIPGWPGRRAALVELEEVLVRLPAAEACTARDAADVIAAWLALEEGDLATARRRLAAHDARYLRHGSPTIKRRTGLSLASALASAGGDAARADALLDAAEEIEDPEGHFPVIVQEFRLRAAAATGDPARRLAAARRALAVARGGAGSDGLAARRGVIAALAVRELEAAGAPDVELCDGHDVVATALFARILELDEAVRSLPTLGLAELDAAQELAAFRDAGVGAQRAALDRVAAWFGDGHRLPPDVRERIVPNGWAHVCAWCRRLRPSDGGWLPIGQFIRRGTAVNVTHTICPGCATSTFADARARWTT